MYVELGVNILTVPLSTGHGNESTLMHRLKELLRSELIERILKFRCERDWEQFHKPKDMVLSLMIEAAELAEHVQWKSDNDFVEHLKTKREEFGDELADVLYWVLLLSHDLEIDLVAAFKNKMDKNEKKYPVQKARGMAKKYNEI